MTGIRQTYPWNRVIPPFRNRPQKSMGGVISAEENIRYHAIPIANTIPLPHHSADYLGRHNMGLIFLFL